MPCRVLYDIIGFTQKGSLAKHLLTHSGEKPYKCSVEGCHRAFAQSGNLARHSRSHTDEKLFSCNYCNKNFRRKDTVRQHELTHTQPNIDTQYSNSNNINSNTIKPASTQSLNDTIGNALLPSSSSQSSRTAQYDDSKIKTEIVDSNLPLPRLPADYTDNVNNISTNNSNNLFPLSTPSVSTIASMVTRSSPDYAHNHSTIHTQHDKQPQPNLNNTPVNLDASSIIVKKQLSNVC